MQQRTRVFPCLILILAATCSSPERLGADDTAPSFANVVDRVQPKIVKIYGAGGLRGLEAYQSGFIISAEGHVLTAWSYVLDSDVITVTLDDGRKYEAQLLGADPRLEIALLKVDESDLAHFKLAEAKAAQVGTRVLAFNNLFGVATGNEPASVLHGSVSAITSLQGRRGTFVTPYRGTVYVLDAITNNPGAAGGALTDREGALVGITGKELRNAQNNTWLNYALPIEVVRKSVDDILAGKTISRNQEDRDKPESPLELEALGIVLVPDVLDRTPPFIDRVRSNSPAAAAGLEPDDLVIFYQGQLTQSCKMLREELSYTPSDAKVRFTVLRDQELIEVELEASREER